MKQVQMISLALLISGSAAITSSCGHKKEKECCEKNDSAKIDAKGILNEQNKESIYQLEGQWLNQDNRTIQLSDLKGKIQITAMIFTNCLNACPRIVADLQLIESKIPADKKDQVNFLLISFDTERDKPERLKAFAKEMRLNQNWTLLHGSEEQIREVSVVLGVKYEKQSDGSFAHSNIITTLNPEGMIMYQQEGLGVSPDKTMEAIEKLLK